MRRNKGLLICMMICVFLLTACGNPLTKLIGDKETDVNLNIENDLDFTLQDGLRETMLYYRDQEGILIPVMKKIPWEEGIAKSALRQLIDEPQVREELNKVGLNPVFPTGTEILGMSINEGLCKVDFNEAVLNHPSELEERAMIQSLVYTLTEFEAIDQVELLVNGEKVDRLKHGTQTADALRREQINLSAVIDDEMVPVTVYYKTTTNGVDSYFVPVTKGIQALKADIKSALVALLEGAPEGTNLYSEIPEGVVVEDVYVKDGIAYIDLSEEIKRIPDNAELQQSMVYEIGLTLKAIEPTISQVRILSGGKELELGAGVKLNLPTYSNLK
ncbi:GerMN domain-containing protein [Alkaliphilus crotonatoxidans]